MTTQGETKMNTNELINENVQTSIVNAEVSSVFEQSRKIRSLKDNQIKIGEWALTSEAQHITEKASFLVYDFLTGRYENTLKDLSRDKVTKKQVYRILGKTRFFQALPNSVIKNYVKRIKEF